MYILSRIFLILGFALVIFGGSLVMQRHSPQTVAFSTGPDPRNTVSADKPVRIHIADATIDLPILPAQITNGQWETTPSGVSHLTSSPIPGNFGNSILYGHNWNNLLGNLRKVKVGQKISVSMRSGEKRTFTTRFISVVTPDQTNIIAPTADRRITLYTCTGFLDRERLVITAILDETETSKKVSAL